MWLLAFLPNEITSRREAGSTTFGSAAPATPSEVMTAQIHLVHAWRRFPFLDPSLPGELLPAGWAGARAAALFGTLHARWDGPAVRHWRALQGSVG